MSDWHRNRRRAQESELQVCAAYRLGTSTQQLAEAFGIDQATVRNMLRRNNIKARGRSESMKLRCKDRLFVENRARKLRGKPSGAFGRRWKIGRSIKKPTLRGAGCRVPPLYPLTRAHEGRAGMSAVDSATCWGRLGGAVAAGRRRPFVLAKCGIRFGADAGARAIGADDDVMLRPPRRRRATGSSPNTRH